MRTVFVLLLGCCLFVGCTSTERRFAAHTRIAREFLSAAARGDSGTMLSLASNPDVVHQTLVLAREYPELMRAVNNNLRVTVGSIRGDTSIVDFRVRGSKISTQLGLLFRLLDGHWKIDHLRGFPPIALTSP